MSKKFTNSRKWPFLFLTALLFVFNQALTDTGGPGSGYTGAPSESNCTSCHSGTVNSGYFLNRLNLISGMSNNQYIPDSTYAITIRMVTPGCNKFGFQTTVLNSSNAKVGTFTITNSAITQLYSGTRDYVGHTSSGTTPSHTDSTQWTFNWKAPSTNVGTVTFYVACNVANNNSGNSGDTIYTKSFPIQVSANLPVAQITTDKNSVCIGDSVFFQGSGTNNPTGYNWTFPGGTPSTSTLQNVWVKFAAVGTPNCSLRVSNSTGNSTIVTKSISVLSQPIATIGVTGATTFCQGDSVKLQGNSGTGLRYQWLRDGNQLTNDTLNVYYAKASGSYTLKVTNSNGCSRVSSAVSVTVNPIPAIPLVSAPINTICSGDSIRVATQPQVGVSYNWLLGGNSFGAPNDSVVYLKTAGTYTVRVTNSNNCSLTSQGFSLSVTQSPTAGIIRLGNATICQGDSVILRSQSRVSGDTYQWLVNGNPIANATDTQIVVKNNGTYSLRVTRVSCSSVSASEVISVLALPTTNFTSSPSGCTFLLTADTAPGYQYQWRLNNVDINAATSRSFLANASGNYSVRITSPNTCSATSSSQPITLLNVPVANISSNKSPAICLPDSVTLTADPTIGTIQWNLNGNPINNANGQTYIAKATGNYSISVTNTTCTNTSNIITVSVKTVPSAMITPSGSQNLCQGDSLKLSVPQGSGLSYVWTNNSSVIAGATSHEYFARSSGIYKVVVSNGNCDSVSQSVPVVVRSRPVSVLTATDTSFCQGDSVLLSVASGTGLTYSWVQNGSPIIGATGATFRAKTQGNYSVIVSDSFCSATSNTLFIREKALPPIPVITKTGNTLNSSAANGNQWLLNGNPISGANSQTFTPNQNGTYKVKVTSPDGCSSESVDFVFVNNSIGDFGSNGAGFLLYPNPAQQFFSLSYSALTPRVLQISLFNTEGKLVELFNEIKMDDGNNQIIFNIDHLPAGLYFVEVKTEINNVVYKLSKQ